MSTLDYYNNNALEYFKLSLNADMKLVYECFLKNISLGSLILDFGCGSGRDSKYFIDNGYKVDAIDGSSELCRLASEYLKIEVKCIKFNEFDEYSRYDGIWACSSLLHIPKNELKSILIKLRDALKINGILYVSLKNGCGEEMKNGRYFNYLTYSEFMDIIKDIELLENIEFFQTNSSVNKDEGKVWNNFILRKMEG